MIRFRPGSSGIIVRSDPSVRTSQMRSTLQPEPSWQYIRKCGSTGENCRWLSQSVSCSMTTLVRPVARSTVNIVMGNRAASRSAIICPLFTGSPRLSSPMPRRPAAREPPP